MDADILIFIENKLEEVWVMHSCPYSPDGSEPFGSASFGGFDKYSAEDFTENGLGIVLKSFRNFHSRVWESKSEFDLLTKSEKSKLYRNFTELYVVSRDKGRALRFDHMKTGKYSTFPADGSNADFWKKLNDFIGGKTGVSW